MDLAQYVTDDKLTIHYWGDPVLSVTCTPFEASEFGEELENFGLLMLGTIDGTIPTNNKEQPGRGLGLAAPQVGLTRCIVVIKRKNVNLPPIIAVNPVITGTYGNPVSHLEGCLSLPEVWTTLSRPAHIRMKYQHPRSGESFEIELGGGEDDVYDAYCAQHELDHLSGIEFISRENVSRQVNRAALREWDKVKSKYTKM